MSEKNSRICHHRLSNFSFRDSFTGNNLPYSVVSWLHMEADLLVSREACENHWGDWATVQVERLIANVWVGNYTNFLPIAHGTFCFPSCRHQLDYRSGDGSNILCTSHTVCLIVCYDSVTHIEDEGLISVGTL